MKVCSDPTERRNSAGNNINCQRLQCYYNGFCSALQILQGDVQSVFCDALKGAKRGRSPYYPWLCDEPKEFCLCSTCACNGPAIPTPGDYCLVKGCNCCNPCCWCPPKCVYIPPVADGPHPVRTEFFYLKQVPTGGCDENGNQNYCYYEDSGVTFLCRPRNARGQWTRTCHDSSC